MEVSKPEPLPKKEGIEITPIVIRTLSDLKDQTFVDKAIALVKARHAFGVSKYHQGLMSHDGRDDIEDCLQEIGDCMQYLIKAKVNGKDISKIQEMVSVLNRLMECDVHA